jgi:hypothetical protein
MGYPHPWVTDRLAGGASLQSYPLDLGRVAMLHGEFAASRLVADGLPEEAMRLDRRTAVDMAHHLQRLDRPFVLAAVSERTVYLASNALAMFYWAPFEHTVYFSSSLTQFNGVCPFGQSPVPLPPGTVLDLTTQEAVRW